MCTLLHRFILYSLTSDGVCNVHKFIQPALEDYLQTGEKSKNLINVIINWQKWKRTETTNLTKCRVEASGNAQPDELTMY